MCAIAGIINGTISEERIEKMLDTMHRRGPDAHGILQNRNCTFLHSRLAIIDPDGGKQPMELKWKGKTYWLIYNGELYNSSELRKELTEYSHRFSGHSDTEIVLHSYAQWGEECVAHFNGIFAFAVWEENTEKLFLARDRIGVKPLFYTEQNGYFIFSSEIKTLFASGEIHPALDQSGAMQIMLLGPGRIPGSGVFHNIQELEPGYTGTYMGHKLHLHQYWKLTDLPHTDSFEETAKKVRFLVEDAIKRQMISDVPIGTFLSGGLDSSIITAVCAKEEHKKGNTLNTFSVDYRNNEQYFQSGKFQPDSDNMYIQIMRDSIPTCHHSTELTPDDLVDNLEKATLARDLPGMADVDFSLIAFCQEIREHVKVALSGECADEIFGGYPWFRDPDIRERAGFPWSQTTKERAALLQDMISFNAESYVMDHYSDTCKSTDVLPGTSALERRMKEMMNLNFRWFMQTLLDRKDRMSMYHGLEVRVPFCDYRIAEYLYRVPWVYKDYHGREKGLLRYAVSDLLPEKIIKRKKSPYPKTFDPRYEQIVYQKLEKILNRGSSPLFALINPSKLRSFLTEESAWPWYGQLMRRPQTIAYFLQIDFWLQKYQVDLLF